MMQSFPYTLQNGYPVIQVGEYQMLLNTGSAESMGRMAQFTLDKRTHPIKPSTLRLTVESLSSWLSTPVDGMLGADILTQYDFKLLPERMQIVFTTGEFRPYGYANHFELYMGVPITPVSIFNQDMRLFFVTAARRSYLNADLLRGQIAHGTTTEYYPGIGVFTTSLYRIAIWVAGYDVELEVGEVPAPLASMLSAMDSRGVLGIDVLRGFEVCMAPRRREGFWWRLGFGSESPEGQRRDPNDVPGYYY